MSDIRRMIQGKHKNVSAVQISVALGRMCKRGLIERPEPGLYRLP